MQNIPTNEKGHFLDEKQKQVKQKIMEDCLDGLFKNLHENKDVFPEVQHVLDLIFSVLVMYNREILVHLFKNGLDPNTRKQTMKNLFEHIKNEVNNKVKNPIPMTSTRQ